MINLKYNIGNNNKPKANSLLNSLKLKNENIKSIKKKNSPFTIAKERKKPIKVKSSLTSTNIKRIIKKQKRSQENGFKKLKTTHDIHFDPNINNVNKSKREKNKNKTTNKDKCNDNSGENKTVINYQPKNDIFDEIMKELENTKSPQFNSKDNKENFDSTNMKIIPNPVVKENNFPLDSNDINIISDFKISKNKNNLDDKKDDSQFTRMEKLREGLQNQPHFDFGIPLNENSSLSVIQKFKEKKETKENFENILRKINILKWMKVYTILMNKEIQNINLCLNTLKKMYSFNSGNY